MTDQPLSFDEGHPAQDLVACSRCGAKVNEYWAVDGAVLCTRCKDEVLVARASSEGRGGRVAKALAFGSGGMLLGAAVWYAVAKYADIQLALIAILLAFLVGKGVFIGSGRRGGRGYQVMALLLTWFGIGTALVPFQLGGLGERMEQVADSVKQERTAVATPPAAMSDSQVEAELAKLDTAIARPPAHAAAPNGFLTVLLGLGALLVLILSLPVLVIVGSGSFILVIIYGVGLWEAWKLTRRVEPLVSGPHPVGTH
jgi:DNA-directed RNA polymerase subunit RPC12/RpoP